MVNASKKAGLGRTLVRAQRINKQKARLQKTSDKHTVDDQPQGPQRIDLRSVTAQTNLDQFFEEATLAGKQFITERRNVLEVKRPETQTNLHNVYELLPEDESTLTVPRRPKWDESTTPEQLDQLEKLSFLTWRKKLARFQENEAVTLTPFEKNLEIWRQLWRVIERSDIIIQILDCRNPLLYLCDDLIKYVDEEFKGEKINLILFNKADFLTTEQRRMWFDYFKRRGMKVIFFSALLENNSNTAQNASSEEDVVINRLQNDLSLDKEEEFDDVRIYTKFELIDTWREEMSLLPSKPTDRPMTVGLVGYPNVGKSSTINALLSAKRVAVSATPGKTKHFQTFLIDRDMMLCDCPGLVFPNVVGNKSEMVINGVLPIDQMKDYVEPVRLIVNKFPRVYFEDLYGLAFEHDAKQNIIAEDLLNAFGFMRGFMTPRGMPDLSRASRVICKDYIKGKLLYCEPPPDSDKKLYHNHSRLAAAMEHIEERMNSSEYALRITARQRRIMIQARGEDPNLNDPELKEHIVEVQGAHIKGLPGIGNLTKPLGSLDHIKVAKRAKKHKKREKLRRIYGHLDN